MIFIVTLLLLILCSMLETESNDDIHLINVVMKFKLELIVPSYSCTIVVYRTELYWSVLYYNIFYGNTVLFKYK